MGATRWVGWLLMVALAGCGPAVEEEEEEQEGPPPPDTCNTKEDALTNPMCQLVLGDPRQELIGLPGDVDYFSVKLPGGLTGRSLLHIAAGYGVPSTPVNLAVVVTTEAEVAVALGIDKHGAAAPAPIDLIVKYSESNARLLLVLRDDQNGKHFDYRAPYQLKVEVVDDPDVNEPNDVTPTALPLVAQGDKLVGTQQGYLSTRDDVDRFKFQIPAGKGVLHLRVTGPKLMPAPPFRVSFTLFNGAGTVVAEGHALNEYVPIDLATARAASAGDYVLEVKGYKTQAQQSLPGDLRLKYTIDAQVLTELDGNEPNNALEAAKTQTLTSPGQSATLRGRIGQVGDPDWFGFDLPALSRPTVLHYKLTPGSAAGRFPALPGLLDRQVRIFSEVKDGATILDRQNNCRTKPAICPRREDAPPDQLGLADAYCGLSPPRCMWSAREEHSKFPGLRNFEGAVPIAAHSATTRFFVLVEDEGNNWADDREYTLTVTWRDDADEAGRMSGATEQTASRTIAVDPSGSGFPAPPVGAAFELSGRLSYGYGYWRNHDALKGEGIRGPEDYDARSSDSDRYELIFPAGLAAPLDRTWELQWEVDKPVGGERPYDLVMEVEFCDGFKNPSSCSVVKRTLGYKGGDLGAWHSSGVAGTTFQPVYSLESMSDRTKVTALAWGCFCFEPRFVAGGRFFLKVTAVDRDSYADVGYRIRTAIGTYPKAYNGGSCPAPAPAPDGGFVPGCRFTQ